ncbi:MAG: hypothetical protein IKZ39_07290 [Lachnospiraceae bacterium]|nr:hypothetical protein [Lachnospiraceae bacterium]MBR6003271.1 hypothetical protein [Lachnospiraceae bacterium]
MFKSKKGTYGYIARQRKIEIIKTVIMLALSFALYNIGIYSTGSNKNLLTLVAVLGCLPMAKFCVNAIMFIKAKGCSAELHNKLEGKGLTPDFYDLYFTAFKKNYQASALIYKRKNLIVMSEDPKIDTTEGEEHLKTVLKNAGASDATVKIFTDSDKFMERLSELQALEDDNKSDFIKDNILSVSL